MICHSNYEEDARIQREAQVLVDAGHRVDVLALRRRGLPAMVTIRGVQVRRLPGEHVQGRGIVGYLREYGLFLAAASAAVLAYVIKRRRYDLVQVHTLPDFLVFAALPLKVAGVPVVLDLHEAMPAFFSVRFGRLRAAWAHRIIAFTERASVRFADHLITVNDSLRDRLVALGIPEGRVTVVLNSPDLSAFDPSQHPHRPFMTDGVLRLAYAGSLTPLYEVDVIFAACAQVREELRAEGLGRDLQVEVYGRGDSEAHLRRRAAELGLADRVVFHGRVPVEEIPARLAGADVGLAPTRLDAYTVLSVSTKLFEAIGMGKPVVASRLPTVERYLGPDGLAYYQAGDPESAAGALLRLIREPAWREETVCAAQRRLADWAWPVQAARYRAVVEALAGA